MKRLATLALLVPLTGCSNAPIAGFLDTCFPSKPVGLRDPDRPREGRPPADRIPPQTDLGAPVGPPRGNGN